jgi:hypothetical protein
MHHEIDIGLKLSRQYNLNKEAFTNQLEAFILKLNFSKETKFNHTVIHKFEEEIKSQDKVITSHDFIFQKYFF